MGRGTTQIDIGWHACRAFLGHRIIACGVTSAQAGFAFFRPPGTMGVVMAGVTGSGHALLGDRWVRWPAGHAVLMPASASHGYCHAGPGPWQVAWICYRDDPGVLPVVPGSACTLVRFDAEPLAHAIADCQRERFAAADASLFHHYAGLIDLLARRVARHGHDDRLDVVWQAVHDDLARPWTLGDLARLAGLAPETLRVACQRVTGRSPVEHVTRLRLERAAAILSISETPVAAVAEAVGYGNPFAFSTAFKRTWGVSPATYRGQRRGGLIIPDR